jgi:hypothetical protein
MWVVADLDECSCSCSSVQPPFIFCIVLLFKVETVAVGSMGSRENRASLLVTNKTILDRVMLNKKYLHGTSSVPWILFLSVS